MILKQIECEYPTVIKLSPDNKILAIGDSDGNVFLYDFPNGELINSFKAHRCCEVLDIAFSRDGKKLVSCSEGDNDIKLWKVKSYGVSFIVGRGFNHITNQIVFTPDNKYIVGTSKRYLRLYDLKNLDQISRFNYTMDIYIETLCFSPYGFYLASGSDENNIKIWKYPSTKFLRSYEGHTKVILQP